MQNTVGIKNKPEIWGFQFFLTDSCKPWHASVRYSGRGTSCSVRHSALCAPCSAKPCHQQNFFLASVTRIHGIEFLEWGAAAHPPRLCLQQRLVRGAVLHRAGQSLGQKWLDAFSRLAVTGRSIRASKRPTVCHSQPESLTLANSRLWIWW